MAFLKDLVTQGAANLDAGVSVSTAASPGTGQTSAALPPTETPIPCGIPISRWKIQAGETIYLNIRDPGSVGPTAWVPMTVAYVFSDGNAVLIREPNITVDTGNYIVGDNLRRKSETYLSDYPGP